MLGEIEKGRPTTIDRRSRLILYGVGVGAVVAGVVASGVAVG